MGFTIIGVVAGAIWAACAENGHVAEDSSEPVAAAGTTKLAAIQEIDDILSRGLVGSAHDFRQADGRPLDLCTPCHTPHVSYSKAPLLDRRPQAYRPVRSYQAVGVTLDDSSLLCLSCHDGITARDVYSYAHATSMPGKLGGSWIGTGNLTSHPVGVPYPLTDPKYHPAAAVTGSGRIKLPDGRVQCISCHDPHNTHRHPGMLTTSNDGSRLCLSCHDL